MPKTIPLPLLLTKYRQRILREKYFPFLKIKYDGNYSVLPKDIDIFTERIKAIQQKLDGQTVATVYDQIRIEEFFNSISNMLYGRPYQDVMNEESEQVSILTTEDTDVANDDKGQSSGNPASRYNSNNDTAISVDEANNSFLPSANNSQTIGRDVFNGCATIIPYSYRKYVLE